MQFDINENFKGKLLIAMPSMQDEIFKESVIYITEHSTIAGAVGVMVNQALYSAELLINEPVFSELDNLLHGDFKERHARWKGLKFYLGGPVNGDDGFILYSYHGEDKLILNASHKMEPELDDAIKPLLVAKGYCSWGTLQLEREVRNNQWLVLESHSLDYLLENFQPTLRYEGALRLLGVTSLANFDFSGAGNA